MNIAIVGATLQAKVFAVVLAEVAHRIHWLVPHLPQDGELSERINTLHERGHITFVHNVAHLPHDLETCLLCYRPTEKENALLFLDALKTIPTPHLTMMINGSTFGLHGTAQLQAKSPQYEWSYLPDTIQEGNALKSFLEAKQIMVGLQSEASRTWMDEFLRPFFPLAHQKLFMPILDAELAKLSISGMLATRISYMNDVAHVAETLGVDILNIKQGMAADTRIGASYLSPGVGFGGENFSHDILMLSSEVSKSGAKSRLLEQVWEINEDQKEILFRKLWDYYNTNLQGKTIAIWGASFKENSGNTHNSPIHKMLSALWAQGATVKLHDPEALPEILECYGNREDLILTDDPYLATEHADALCVMTAWRCYYSPNYQRLLQTMNHPLILDGRNIYHPDHMKHLGFIYQGVGRC